MASTTMGAKNAVPKLGAMTTPVPGGANALMGYWFVQGVKPTIFEKNAFNSLEHYEWVDEAAGKLRVTFTYRTGNYDGTEPAEKMGKEGTAEAKMELAKMDRTQKLHVGNICKDKYSSKHEKGCASGPARHAE